jgi:hypothetical protein
MDGALWRVEVYRRADVRVSADAGLEPASSRRSYAPRGDDREWFDRPLRLVDQGNAVPLVNASSARRVILRMMRRERYRGLQLNRRADEPLSVVVYQSAMFGSCARYGALWAPAGCALRWPCRRTEEVPSGTDVMMSTDACAIPASTLQVIDRLAAIAQLPKARRAEVSSMPEGPAIGQVEA